MKCPRLTDRELELQLCLGVLGFLGSFYNISYHTVSSFPLTEDIAYFSMYVFFHLENKNNYFL